MAKQENRNTLSTSVLVRRFLPYFHKYRKPWRSTCAAQR